MGMPKPFSSGRRYTPATPVAETTPNPNPYRFEILEVVEGKRGVAARIKYEGCTTFGGVKILCWISKAIAAKTLSSTSIDPHFSDGHDCMGPDARFPAHGRGWSDALNYVEADTLTDRVDRLMEDEEESDVVKAFDALIDVEPDVEDAFDDAFKQLVDGKPEGQRIDGVQINLGYVESALLTHLGIEFSGCYTTNPIEAIVHVTRAFKVFIDHHSEFDSFLLDDADNEWYIANLTDAYRDFMFEWFWVESQDSSAGNRSNIPCDLLPDPYGRRDYVDGHGWFYEINSMNLGALPGTYVCIDDFPKFLARFDPDKHTPQYLREQLPEKLYTEADDQFLELILTYTNCREFLDRS